MALAPGTRFGVYEVLATIGEGGMGQVFRARDTKLDRDVAIKILPEAFEHDADRLARFTREAKTLASLNHPNIAGIYGLETGQVGREGREGRVGPFLVMELVEGDDLSQRITQGAISIDEALSIAKQIAEALEAAHEQGIIHRDLKPANIKVRTDGTVKVLDFGLAKALERSGESGGSGRPGRAAGVYRPDSPDRPDRPDFSPDGRWVAYNVNKTSGGTPSPDRGIFVQPFPPTGATYQVPKTRLDFHPAWGPSVRDIFYVPAAVEDALIAVGVQTTGSPTFGATAPLKGVVPPGITSTNYRGDDVLPDGRFITLLPDESGPAGGRPELRLILNWFDELKRLVPTN